MKNVQINITTFEAWRALTDLEEFCLENDITEKKTYWDEEQAEDALEAIEFTLRERIESDLTELLGSWAEENSTGDKQSGAYKATKAKMTSRRK